jgi:hypothetical protein
MLLDNIYSASVTHDDCNMSIVEASGKLDLSIPGRSSNSLPVDKLCEICPDNPEFYPPFPGRVRPDSFHRNFGPDFFGKKGSLTKKYF